MFLGHINQKICRLYIGVYANKVGSTLFYCSLDAEGAFDFLPHCVILQKSINIISDINGVLQCVLIFVGNHASGVK